jgi:hypothetical protein
MWLCVVWVAFVVSAKACSIPVYRYALERWDSDFYRVIVFYENALPEGTSETLAPLVNASSQIYGTLPSSVVPEPNEVRANVSLRFVDLAGEPDGQMLQLWQAQKHPELPWVVIRFPRSARMQHILWCGPLDALDTATLVESPARTRIVEHLIRGETGVWVLLETGNEAQDEQALERLQAGLEAAEGSLELPEIDPQDQEEWLSGEEKPALKIAYHIVRVARSDLEEIPLITMLIKSEPEMMKHLREPIAFSVFGRGRALKGLAGDSITEVAVLEACRFLVESCQCVIKEQNPGIDLLLTADWEQVFEALPPLETPETMLVGVTDFLESEEGAPVQTAALAEPDVAASIQSPMVIVGIVLVAGLVAAVAWTLRVSRTGAAKDDAFQDEEQAA